MTFFKSLLKTLQIILGLSQFKWITNSMFESRTIKTFFLYPLLVSHKTNCETEWKSICLDYKLLDFSLLFTLLVFLSFYNVLSFRCSVNKRMTKEVLISILRHGRMWEINNIVFNVIIHEDLDLVNIIEIDILVSTTPL